MNTLGDRYNQNWATQCRVAACRTLTLDHKSSLTMRRAGTLSTTHSVLGLGRARCRTIFRVLYKSLGFPTSLPIELVVEHPGTAQLIYFRRSSGCFRVRPA